MQQNSVVSFSSSKTAAPCLVTFQVATFVTYNGAWLEQEIDIWVLKETRATAPQRPKLEGFTCTSISQHVFNYYCEHSERSSPSSGDVHVILTITCLYSDQEVQKKRERKIKTYPSWVSKESNPWQSDRLELFTAVHSRCPCFQHQQRDANNPEFSLLLPSDWLANWLAVNVTDGVSAHI